MEVKSVSGSEEFVAGVRTNTRDPACNLQHIFVFCNLLYFFFCILSLCASLIDRPLPHLGSNDIEESERLQVVLPF